MRSRIPAALVAATLCLSLPAFSQSTPPAAAKPEVLILGVYHMGTQSDVFKTDVDDVLSPKRQAEMAAVIAALQRFRPTKVAIEANFGDQRYPKRYADYLAGKHELTRNEIEQIGFRVAKAAGHTTVYPVDADGEFPYPRLVKFMKASGREQEWKEHENEIRAMVDAQSAYLASHTILDTLLYINSDPRVAEAVGHYFREAQFGEAWDWAGADLVSDWFRRNMRIYTNISTLLGPNERLLVIYGAGHLGWLRFAFENTSNARLRKLAEFAK